MADSPDAPRPSSVTVDGKEFKVAREGRAEILAPFEAGKEARKTRAGGEEQSVFYNPIQQFNRDLSVLAIRVFAEELVASRNAIRSRGKARARKSGKPPRSASKRKRDDDGDDDGDAADAAPEAKKARAAEETVPIAEAQTDAAEDIAAAPSHIQNGDVPDQPPAVKRDQPAKTYFRILDALSASGLRALRYAKEIPEVTHVTANDLSAKAVESIKRNIEHNGVKDTVFPNIGSAASHMYWIGTDPDPRMPDGTRGKYDVVDLDPYGSAAPFIDSSVQAVNDGGMLCVTCTDSAVFASLGYLEKTFAQYGGMPWRGNQSHEAGLRLIMQSVATSAARCGLAVEPLLSLSIDYYVRIFIRVKRSPNEVKLLPGKTMLVYNCDTGCGSWTRQFLARTQERTNKNGDPLFHFTAALGPHTTPHCEHCGSKMHVVGPMWGGPLQNPYFVQRMLDKLPELDPTIYGTKPRIEGMLTVALHETLLRPSTLKGDQEQVRTNGNGAPPKEDSKEQQVQSTESPTYKPLQRLDPSLPDHSPFFFLPSDLCRTLRCNVPSDSAIRGALMHLGYQVTRSHTKGGSIRTDAPFSVIWDVMKAWVRKRAPLKDGALKENTPGWRVWNKGTDDALAVECSLRELLKQESSVQAVMSVINQLRGGSKAKEPPEQAAIGIDATAAKDAGDISSTALSADGERREVVFDEQLGKDPDRGKKLVRYQLNPTEHWGPQARAK